MLRFVAATGWSRIFLTTTAGPRVAHVPLIVDAERGVVRFHLARRNALHDSLDGASALALVEGPHAYVSANWYADPTRHVPTWNYVAVECEGPVRRLEATELASLLDALTEIHESSVGEDWSRRTLEPARFETMLEAITAFELRISKIRGTRKLSQNQPRALSELANQVEASGEVALAELMRSEMP